MTVPDGYFGFFGVWSRAPAVALHVSHRETCSSAPTPAHTLRHIQCDTCAGVGGAYSEASGRVSFATMRAIRAAYCALGRPSSVGGYGFPLEGRGATVL